MKQLYFIIAFILTCIIVSNSAFALDKKWIEVGNDLSYLDYQLYENSFFAPHLHFVRIDSKKSEFVVIQAKNNESLTVREAATNNKLLLAINANFFDNIGKPLGLVINDKKLLHPIHQGGKTITGVFGIDKEHKVKIIHRSQVTPDSFLLAVQAGPRLMINGEFALGIRSPQVSSRRAGVCIDKSENVILYCSSQGFRGVSINQLQQILKEVGCISALNLDGGGSAQFFIGGEAGSKITGSAEPFYIAGDDRVPVILGVIKKQ